MTRPRLLIADDSVTIRKVVELTFADEGIDVTAVGTAQEAMERFVDIQPDIVLVDVGLEGTNGYQICSMIKQDEQTKDIPVLLLVGSFEPFSHEEAENAHSDGFVTKPFHSIRDLVVRVSELLNGDLPSTPVADPVPVPAAVTPDTEDIDHLYQSSFAETVEIEQFDTMETLFDHDGFDDEMIEALHPGGGAEEGSERVNEEVPLGQAVTEEDLDVPPNATEELAASAVEEAVHLDAPAMDETEPVASEIEPRFEPRFSFSEAEPDPEADTGSVTMTETESEAEPELYGESATKTHPEGDPADASGEAEQLVAGSDAFAELATETPDREGVIASHQDEDCYPTIAEPEWEPSPEMIAVLAQKVVERLSDRVVREIAQDAVPRIAEKLIREALDDGKKD